MPVYSWPPFSPISLQPLSTSFFCDNTLLTFMPFIFSCDLLSSTICVNMSFKTSIGAWWAHQLIHRWLNPPEAIDCLNGVWSHESLTKLWLTDYWLRLARAHTFSVHNCFKIIMAETVILRRQIWAAMFLTSQLLPYLLHVPRSSLSPKWGDLMLC